MRRERGEGGDKVVTGTEREIGLSVTWQKAGSFILFSEGILTPSPSS